jgi:uncharacterized MAPEG superfamily protein
VFAAAVVAANTAKVPLATLNGLILGYVASRVVYNYVYVVLQNNSKMAPVRSPTWLSGAVIISWLFVLVGKAAN